MRDDLQELVDEVSRVLGAPATLEDAEFTLLAFCAHDDDLATMDAVRTRSILTRGSPPATRAWFEEFGIASARGPLRTPADPAAGILTRLVLPVRHADRTHGYLWLLDGGRVDPADSGDPALTAAVALAARAGRLLAERGGDAADLGAPLAAVLTGDAAERDRATRALADALGTDGPQVLVALVPGAAGLPARWQLPGAGAVATPVPASAGPPLVAVLVPVPGSRDLRPAGALAASALSGLPPGSAAGVSEVRRGPAALTEQWRQARAAARVAAAVERFFPVAHWAELGAWRAVTELAEPDPVVAPLLRDPVLAGTAEVFLDCAGSASRAAEALHVHRQTLYYRLSRIEAVTGLDLADGEHRLLVHAALKAARLVREPVEVVPPPGPLPST